MNRRTLLQALSPLLTLSILPACSRGAVPAAAAPGRSSDTPAGTARAATVAGDIAPLDKRDADWKPLLSTAAYGVLFNDDTERAGSSPLDREKRPGTFVCAACYLPLFGAADKFDSGTGWPSFTQPILGHIASKRDFKLIFPRTEYHCVRCEGHQGHLFSDGPQPRGERWCNNGLALQFVPQGEPLPALRS